MLVVTEFLMFEHHLLNLASKFLKRKIVLVPYFEEDKRQSFILKKRNILSKFFKRSRTYYLIFCCSEGYTQNFYMSTFFWSEKNSGIYIRNTNPKSKIGFKTSEINIS